MPMQILSMEGARPTETAISWTWKNPRNSNDEHIVRLPLWRAPDQADDLRHGRRWNREEIEGILLVGGAASFTTARKLAAASRNAWQCGGSA